MQAPQLPLSSYHSSCLLQTRIEISNKHRDLKMMRTGRGRTEWPPLHEESELHQACADNDHDKAEIIINKLMSGEGGGNPIELKRLLLGASPNSKQARGRATRHIIARPPPGL